MTRQQKIVKTSIIGIIVNLILVVFKAIVGILTNSIAITLDAVNNLTDALSSIITIIGTKLAGKAPDKEHPYGYVSENLRLLCVLHRRADYVSGGRGSAGRPEAEETLLGQDHRYCLPSPGGSPDLWQEKNEGLLP